MLKSINIHSHTYVMFFDSALRTLWHGQEKCAVGFALDVSKRYVDRANRYPLLMGCNVITHKAKNANFYSA